MCQQEYNLASVLMVFLTNSDPIDRQNLRQVKLSAHVSFHQFPCSGSPASTRDKKATSLCSRRQGLNTEGNRGKSGVLPKILVAYLTFVLYLYLASWLAFLKLVYLPFWSLPAGSLLPLLLLGIAAVTLYNSWKKRRKKLDDRSAAQKS